MNDWNGAVERAIYLLPGGTRASSRTLPGEPRQEVFRRQARHPRSPPVANSSSGPPEHRIALCPAAHDGRGTRGLETVRFDGMANPAVTPTRYESWLRDVTSLSRLKPGALCATVQTKPVAPNKISLRSHKNSARRAGERPLAVSLSLLQPAASVDSTQWFEPIHHRRLAGRELEMARRRDRCGNAMKQSDRQPDNLRCSVIAPVSRSPGNRPETIHQRDLVNTGKSVVIRGELNGSEDLTIEGQVEGTIQPEHVLTIGPNGRIKAQVFARSGSSSAR